MNLDSPETSNQKRQKTESPFAGKIYFLIGAIILALIIIASLYTSQKAEEKEAKKLNLLLLTLDTTRADFLGCYGGKTAKTPNLDRLAAEGALFEHCSTAATLTLPSHTSIFTGLYPFSHGVRRNGTDFLVDQNETITEILHNSGYHTSAVISAYVLARPFGLDQGFDSYLDVPMGVSQETETGGKQGDATCSDGIRILREIHNSSFFLWIHLYDPHFPYAAPNSRATNPVEAYAEEIEFLDFQIGRLLRELTRLGKDKNTMIVVVGDHGESLGQHGELDHGFFNYDATVHVPLIIKCPDLVPEGKRIGDNVRTVDIAPTVLNLLSQSPLPLSHGSDLLPLITGTKTTLNKGAYAESLESNFLLEYAGLRSITADGWKYIRAPKPELYDLVNDPGELTNLAKEKGEILAEMEQQITNLISESPGPPQSAANIDKPHTDLSQLESLGYTGGTATTDQTTISELERYNPSGKNPKDYTEIITSYNKSTQAKTLNNYAMAEELLRRVIEKQPDSAFLLAELASTMEKQGRTDEAIALYEEALALNPVNDTPIRSSYCVLLMQTLRWEEAIAQVTPVVNKYPKNISSLHNMGMSLAAIGKYDEAQSYFDRALKIDANSIRVLHARACAYVWEGKLKKAEQCLRKGLELAPANQLMRNHLQEVIKRQGSGS